MDLFKGRSEYLVGLAAVAMICLTVLVATGKVPADKLIDAAPGAFAAAAALTAAARASRAHARIDEAEAEKKSDEAK